MNERAWNLAGKLIAEAARYRVGVSEFGAHRVVDCGVAATGGLQSGLVLARICLADHATVTLTQDASGPAVQVSTDDPVRSCLGSQYAGWQVKAEKFFAMGSGPMRMLAGREELLKELKLEEQSKVAVGVLESRKPVTQEVIDYLTSRLPKEVERLTLLIAPAASLAGTVQVVARSVETAMHKLHALKFDVHQVVSGFGTAPLPPVAKDELIAIGRTNDAILYGGRVTLWVNTDDAIIDEIGPKVPSSSSNDHGSLFAELFSRYGDFYKIDPLLFSPAEITFVNLHTGRASTFGRTEPVLLKKSFFGE